ncbi:hypothetical protein WJX84_009277 [Apatococcus fuscideae]|uniref:DUF1232 domain-containing protein n=1 Tax=Apatococcus fuscideae TaxID=2026836 RepID=A0AAW1SNA3_9CHLO
MDTTALTSRVARQPGNIKQQDAITRRALPRQPRSVGPARQCAAASDLASTQPAASTGGIRAAERSDTGPHAALWGAVAAYIALTGTAQASLCCLGGLGAGLVYFELLKGQVESLKPGQRSPVLAAQEISVPPLKALALTLAAYSYAIRPRLVIPAALAAGVAAWNSNGLGPKLGWGDDLALIIGFLSFKAPLLLQLWDDNKPRVKSVEELRAARRPVFEPLEVDDTPFDLSKRTGR